MKVIVQTLNKIVLELHVSGDTVGHLREDIRKHGEELRKDKGINEDDDIKIIFNG